jgi:hypothetical protein
MRRRALFIALVLLSSCKRSDASFASASVIRSLDEAIGGPNASARVGDFLLENDQIRAVIEQGGRSHLPLDVGGSLVDLDLQRPEAAFRDGRGLDQLGQIAPLSNLFIADASMPGTVRITHSDAGAEVTVESGSHPILSVISALGLLVARDFIDAGTDYSTFNLYSEFELRPGERLLRVTTTMGFDVPFCRPSPADGCNADCDDINYDKDCRCPVRPDRCSAEVPIVDAEPLPDRPEPTGLSDIFLGDLPRPLGTKHCASDADCDASQHETCASITTGLGGQSAVCRRPDQRDAGLFLGDILLFGGHLAPFIPGTGYDTDSDIRRLFDAGDDTLSTPLELGYVMAIGDRVSYAYAPPEGKVLVPIFGGPFSMGATGAASCRHADPGCLRGQLVRSVRWIAVGSGDASSAEEPLIRARGEAAATIEGVVEWAHSGDPVSGAEVFVVEDPRAKPCDDACKAACGSVEGLDDRAIARMPIAELFDHNRCRSVGGAFLKGVAGVDTFALTDPGTYPIRQGRFRATVRPGRYVVIAEANKTTLSVPYAVTVAGGETKAVDIALEEPGWLEFAIMDEIGHLTPGRATIGRCLPGSSCRSDAECTSGETCEAGACACPRGQLTPFELGGPRYADGAIAFGQTATGKGRVELAPGEYDVVFSRGPDRSIDRQHVMIRPMLGTQAVAKVVRAIDRTGWASADFHVHAGPSLDSGLPVEDRAVSFAAENMDFLSCSDHDVLTNYLPVLASAGVAEMMSTQVGDEVTTQELGHFIGYPMNYEEWTGDPPKRVIGNGAPEWRASTPAQIFRAMRKAEPTDRPHVVEVPHPFSYFDAYRIDPATLEPTDSVITLFNPLLKPENFDGTFDAMELANAKSFDLIRRPTVGEVRFYSQGLDRLYAARASGAIDLPGYQHGVYLLATEATKRFLMRTKTEQDAELTGRGDEIACLCGSDGDCALGRLCNPNTMKCEVPPLDPSGTPPPDDALCRSLRGVVDDWFNMLNRGVRRSGVSGSDVHGLSGYEAGIPRTMVASDAVRPPLLHPDDINQAVLDGKVIVTNGPMIRFSIGGKGVGETLAIADGDSVELDVAVEAAGWYDVDRIEIYRNGELIHWITACYSLHPEEAADPDAHACISQDPGVRVYQERIADTPSVDAWYAVIVLGLDGRTLAPVYSSQVLPRLGTFELTQRIYDIIPALGSLRQPRYPSLYPTFPFAITNPIWVDVGRDGWTAPRASPSWCVQGKDVGCTK